MTGAAVTPLPPLLYEGLVRQALLEDLGRGGDLTTDAVAPAGLQVGGGLVARRPGRLAGVDVALAALRLMDPDAVVQVHRTDGQDVAAGDVVATVRGDARGLLAAERTALNFLGHLSGVATATRTIADIVTPLGCTLVCTRKTTPGLRALEKHAVRAGGGSNHRLGLDDAVLVKDNHRLIAGGVGEAVARARRRVGHMVKVQAEVERLDEIEEALAAGADALLLDNMPPERLREAVDLVAGRAVTEASGTITIETAAAVAASGVDLMSVGWITHSAPVLDVALDLDERAGGAGGVGPGR